MYYYRGRATESWHTIAPKVTIVKNVVVLSCSFLCAYGASFLPIRSYLSLSEDLRILGPLSVSLLYAMAAISGFYGSILARKLTYKMTVALASLPYCLFMGAIAYSQYYTILPAVIILGLSQGPLWNSAIAYLVNMAAQYAYFSYKTQDAMMRRFLSLFNCLLSVGVFLGHLLTAGAFNAIEVTQNRTSKNIFQVSGCGRKFCNPQAVLAWPNFHKNVENQGKNGASFFQTLPQLSSVVPVYFLTLAAGLTVSAAILALFPLGKMTVQLCSQTQKSSTPTQLVVETLQAFRERKLHLMIPLFVVTGIGEAFLTCDVTKAFVACIAPHSTVGYVLFCAFCVSAFLHAFLCSVLKHINRLTVLSASSAIQVGSATVMWMWKPIADDQPILYVVAGSWVMADTIWKALCLTMVFKCYPERWEAPFAVYFISNWLGVCLGFGLCPYGCFEYKLYSYGLFYVGSLIAFCLIENQFQNSSKTCSFDKIVSI